MCNVDYRKSNVAAIFFADCLIGSGVGKRIYNRGALIQIYI